MSKAPALQVENLQTHFRLGDGRLARAVDGVSFCIAPGQTVALVGESGSGKSQTAYSIMRLVADNAVHGQQSRIVWEGQDLLQLGDDQMRHIRGNDIAMIFQEPMTSLNPLYRVGNQLAEPLRLHQGMSDEEARTRGIALLGEVGIPDPEQRIDAYPHELSGGMKQRVMVAMALACQPKLLIADEPTTALDVTVQAQILGLMRELQQRHGMAILLITHDLGVVYQMADDICVMYGGKIAEKGPRDSVFNAMAHPYTRRLMESIPSRADRNSKLHTISGLVPPATDYADGCRFAGRCRIAQTVCHEQEPAPVARQPGHVASCHFAGSKEDKGTGDREDRPQREVGDPMLEVSSLKTYFPVRKGFLMRTVNHVRAVDDLSLTIRRGETIALVGESGCGKTTAGQSILRLVREATGTVVFQGKDLMALKGKALTAMRDRMQLVFQDPYGSLSPRLTVGQIIAEGLHIHASHLSQQEVAERVENALREVGLAGTVRDRYPHEFSGGQRQRISIARAMVLQPDFLVLDEPTSALDVSVQAQILNLLEELQTSHGLAYLFITHDLGVVHYIADRVAVMYLGRIVEHAETEALFAAPRHPYTQALLEAVPKIGHMTQTSPIGDVPSPLSPPPGCPYHPRCASASETCRQERPALTTSRDHAVACHHQLSVSKDSNHTP